MKDKQLQATRDQIVLAVKLSGEKFLAQKKAANETIIISQNGIIKEVNARDIKP
jgi:hypothetical protein